MQKGENELLQRVVSFPLKSPIQQINKDVDSCSDEKETDNGNNMDIGQNHILEKSCKGGHPQKHYLYSRYQQNEDIQHVGKIINKWKDMEIPHISNKHIVLNESKMQVNGSQIVHNDEVVKVQTDKYMGRQLLENQNSYQGYQLDQKSLDNHRYSDKSKQNRKKYESIDSSLTQSFDNSVLSNKSRSFQNSNIGLKNSQNQSVFIQPRKKEKKRKSNNQVQNFNLQNSKSRFSKRQTHITNPNQIIDTRKTTKKFSQIQNERIEIKQESNCFKQFSIQRTLTFVLIYQIFISFLILTSYIFSKYWILLYQVVIIIALPTFFGVKCVNLHKVKYNKKRKDCFKGEKVSSKSKKISNSFYSNKLQQSRSNENLSMGINMQKQYKIHPTSKIQPQINDNISLQNSSTEQNSRFSLLDFQNPPLIQSKYLLVVPYLQNNQFHYFTKCMECQTSHSNSRIKHCKNCDACHYGYDHYCKWLATCIDATNYSYFLKFVMSLWILSVILLVSGIYVLYWSTVDLGGSYIQIGFMCFIVLEIILGFVFCSYIFGYHVWLNFRGVSTQQHFAGIKQNSNNSILCKNVIHQISDQYFDNFLQYIPFTTNQSGAKLDIQQMQSLTSSKFFDQGVEHLEDEQNDQKKTNEEKEVFKLSSNKLMKIHNINQQQQYQQNYYDSHRSKQNIEKQSQLNGLFKIYDCSIPQEKQKAEKSQFNIVKGKKSQLLNIGDQKIKLNKSVSKQKQWISALQADQLATQIGSPIKLSSRRKSNEKN